MIGCVFAVFQELGSGFGILVEAGAMVELKMVKPSAQ